MSKETVRKEIANKLWEESIGVPFKECKIIANKILAIPGLCVLADDQQRTSIFHHVSREIFEGLYQQGWRKVEL